MKNLSELKELFKQVANDILEASNNSLFRSVLDDIIEAGSNPFWQVFNDINQEGSSLVIGIIEESSNHLN